MASDRSLDRGMDRGGKSAAALDDAGAPADGRRLNEIATSQARSAKGAGAEDFDPANLPDEERHALFACMELLFFAYREFTSEPDAILETFKFGRAHHRVLHFVSRNPGLRVADLLEILKITKQSLARVLKQLVDEGFIVQEAGRTDRRERLLYVTERGKSLAGQLADLQMMRLRNAIASAGPDSEGKLRSFLLAMIGEDQRKLVSRLIDKTGDLDTPG